MKTLLVRWRTCRCRHPVAWHRPIGLERGCSVQDCRCVRPRRGGRLSTHDLLFRRPGHGSVSEQFADVGAQFIDGILEQWKANMNHPPKDR